MNRGESFRRKIILLAFITICDSGHANCQFINIHFPLGNPRDLHFLGHNMLTDDPMILIMDCKVVLFRKGCVYTCN